MNSKAIRKQLFAAVAMVLVAAVALGSSTYAWFVASGEVTAQGMNVQAQAETGIVIANATKANYASTASAADTATKQLVPASTWDGTTWYHANSAAYDSHVAATAYTTASTDSYVTHDFYIKSASSSAYTKDIKIKSVTVTGGSTNSLSSALRVGVKFANTDIFYIFAPIAEDLLEGEVVRTYQVNGGKTVTPLNGTSAVNTTIRNIPANNTDGQLVQITLWFEGEDRFCNSSQIQASLPTLSVSVVFSGEDITGAVDYTQPA